MFDASALGNADAFTLPLLREFPCLWRDPETIPGALRKGYILTYKISLKKATILKIFSTDGKFVDF
jgi:hypothetical protein